MLAIIRRQSRLRSSILDYAQSLQHTVLSIYHRLGDAYRTINTQRYAAKLVGPTYALRLLQLLDFCHPCLFGRRALALDQLSIPCCPSICSLSKSTFRFQAGEVLTIVRVRSTYLTLFGSDGFAELLIVCMSLP